MRKACCSTWNWLCQQFEGSQSGSDDDIERILNEVETEVAVVEGVSPNPGHSSNAQPGHQRNSCADDKPNNKKSKRVKSLDTFRGLSITIMIFVNYGGGGYW